jgi:hypothetical protein
MKLPVLLTKIGTNCVVSKGGGIFWIADRQWIEWKATPIRSTYKCRQRHCYCSWAKSSSGYGGRRLWVTWFGSLTSWCLTSLATCMQSSFQISSAFE